MAQDEYAKNLCEWADIIHIQRVAIDKSVPAIKHWRQQGKAVVIDYDDDYFRINKSNAAFKFWGDGLVDVTMADGAKFQSQMASHPIVQFIEGMKSCTAATMPSELLAKDASRYTSAFFVPNYLEKILYPKQNRKPTDLNNIVIGWGGSLSHIESFEHSGIVPALKSVLSSRVKLLIVGDERVPAKLKEMGVKGDNIIYRPYVPYDRWYETLLLYDIGVAPLAQEYDMRRSWIKVAEYMSMGIPFVATDTAPYQNPRTRHHCRTGLYVDQGETADDANEAGWTSALMSAVNNIKKVKRIAEEDSVEHYQNFDIDNNIESIVNIYKEIIEIEK